MHDSNAKQIYAASSSNESHGAHLQQAVEFQRSQFPTLQAPGLGQANAPIGVFDSGVGGLTILSALRQELPSEDYIYVGDTAHCPYGLRSEAEITQLVLEIGRFLVERGVKLIVVACNAASQAALATLRSTFPVPFVGVVPAVKPAAQLTRKGRIGIIATNQAARSPYLQQLIADFARDLETYTHGCSELVTLVERGELDSPLAEEVVRQALSPVLSKDIDVLVLGCTHFPALRPVIERVAGNNVQVIDSGAAIARRTRSVLEAAALLKPSIKQGKQEAPGHLEVWCSGDPASFREIASRILGHPVVVRQASQLAQTSAAAAREEREE
ncbi:glutamate racemase [Thermogemmatispora sp.]|uniref:glutamate racemase n=1 Tax=Thermogemmatispora sp. TaxID=1968838 RepID=UPI001DCB3FD0|nr:glutamate racemase [Thermogemmatispora sp.]MBX5449097.1 glutamate racemase [Thermogemmatispora sp.]